MRGRAADLIELLDERRLTVSTAESLTGGLLASTLVDVPGCSRVFMEGFVTYDTAAKERTLLVPSGILREFGAVSEQTARYMASGAAEKSGTDMAISTTGVAGPDTSEGKPVGLVYIGLFFGGKTAVRRLLLPGTRDMIRKETVRTAIDWVVSVLEETGPVPEGKKN